MGELGCVFCGRRALRGLFVVASDERLGNGLLADPRFCLLCIGHQEMLHRAGRAGREGARTGVRWWVVGEWHDGSDPGVPLTAEYWESVRRVLGDWGWRPLCAA
jgi:hypothetical protein